MALALWSTVEDFDADDKSHYHVYLHDCAADGTDCQELLHSDVHVDDWNRGSTTWVYKELPLGSIDRTFAPGRILRVRLMFQHQRMWIAMTQDNPTRLILNDG